MKFSKIKTAALAAALAVAPLSGVYAADPTPPPSPNTNPGAGASSGAVIDWMESTTYNLTQIYDWLTKQFNEGSDGIGYIVYNTFHDAVNSLMYFFNDLIPDSWGWKAEKILGGTVVQATDKDGNTYEYLTTPTTEGCGINWVEKDLNCKQPTPFNTPPVPIDGGASLLLAAGAAYGLKRLRRRKGETSEN